MLRESQFPFLKALDLGGGDQRKLFKLLDQGDVDGASALLLKIKKGASNRSYVLTGGTLSMRRQNAARLVDALAPAAEEFAFYCIDPEEEGRLTLKSCGTELRRMLTASDGRMSHVLMVAKGSTDMHLAWMDASGAVADAPGCTLSCVHRPKSDVPSTAMDLFRSFVSHAANAALLAAAAEGTIAIVLAGASVHVVNAGRAAGSYFKRVHRSQFEAAPHDKADFERFLALEWNDEVCARAGGRRRMADPDEAPPSMAGMRRNLFFVGA